MRKLALSGGLGVMSYRSIFMPIAIFAGCFIVIASVLVVFLGKRNGKRKTSGIERALRKQFIFGMIFSVMLVGGILMIVFGSVHRLWGLLAVGIAFTVIGFYGTPVAWTVYGNKKGIKRVVYAVDGEKLFTVGKIAAQLGKSEKFIRGILDECFRKGYLEGYIRNGDEIAPNEAKGREEKAHVAECNFCGAKFTYKGEVGVCPYCGAAVERSEKN